MIKLFSILLMTLTIASCTAKVQISDVAESVSENGFRRSDIDKYPGSCFLQGAAEYAHVSSDARLYSLVKETMDSFVSGERPGFGSFISYSIGGTAAAELALWGEQSYVTRVLEVADSMFRTQPRNTDGVMTPPWESSNIRPDGMFVDGIFAVTPYLLYSGIIAERQDWIDYAAWITLKTFEVLRDHQSGLIHQARGVLRLADGEISQDCWSRGNGWGCIALATLMRNLPKDNEHYPQVVELCKDYFQAVLRYQNEEGLWHQEMTYPDSWVEISGSALMLYGIGTAVDCGILPSSCKRAFVKGMEALLTYIDINGNIASVCGGCLAPGNSSKDTYNAKASYWNERHAFGPVMLALSAARSLGINSIKTELGSSIPENRPACVVRHVEKRKDDMAWENDWAAYRIYSQKSPVNKISSGIDYWGKTVDYPILDKWYEADSEGGSYHKDMGEGYDFYVVGKNRGTGGSGVWADGKLYASEPYQEWTINDDDKDHISFTVSYPPFKAGDETINQTTTFSAVIGSPFICVETTLESESGKDLVLAAGLTTFGNEEILKNADGRMWIQEDVDDGQVKLHSILVTDPARDALETKFGADRLLLMNVKSGESVKYYFSAMAGGSPRMEEWVRIIKDSNWTKIENEHQYD